MGSQPNFVTGHFSFAKGGRDTAALAETLKTASPEQAATLRITSILVDRLHEIWKTETRGLANGDKLELIAAIGVNLSRSMVMSFLGTAVARKEIDRDMAVSAVQAHDVRAMEAIVETRESTVHLFIDALQTIETEEGKAR